RALPAEQGLPIVIEIGIVHSKSDRFPLHISKTRRSEELRQSIWQGQCAGKEPVTCNSCLRIDPGRGVPEKPLVYKTTTKIPDTGDDDPTGSCHTLHLVQRRTRIWHEIEYELRSRPGKRVVFEPQSAGLSDLKTDRGACCL